LSLSLLMNPAYASWDVLKLDHVYHICNDQQLVTTLPIASVCKQVMYQIELYHILSTTCLQKWLPKARDQLIH
jgi:hypothetical protein